MGVRIDSAVCGSGDAWTRPSQAPSFSPSQKGTAALALKHPTPPSSSLPTPPTTYNKQTTSATSPSHSFLVHSSSIVRKDVYYPVQSATSSHTPPTDRFSCFRASSSPASHLRLLSLTASSQFNHANFDLFYRDRSQTWALPAKSRFTDNRPTIRRGGIQTSPLTPDFRITGYRGLTSLAPFLYPYHTRYYRCRPATTSTQLRPFVLQF